MKLLIASDLHGSAYWTERLLNAYQASGADKLLLLGDVLYHGPRNPLPDDYAPPQVAALLNRFADSILAIAGNCDAEVDQLLLDFPISAPHCLLALEGQQFFATHGHLFGPEQLPRLKTGCLLSGHTHVPRQTVINGVTCINPGSVSLPKENSPHSYLLLNGECFTWYDLATGRAFSPA